MTAGTLAERQQRRRAFRVALFTRRGLPQDEAETWADVLTRRDADRDDRHLCLECMHIQHDGHCSQARAGRIPGLSRSFHARSVLLMQRCVAFKWVTPA